MKIIQICKIINAEHWYLISNTRTDQEFHAAQVILKNTFNEYVAYVNSGVEYRFIRVSDLPQYDTAVGNWENSDVIPI